MSLEDEIQDRLVTDAESILQDNLERVENLFELHGDGTIKITDEYRNLDPENRMLIYLIGQRYAKEGNMADEETLSTEFFYDRIDRGKRTIRGYLQELRDTGLVTKEGQSDHLVIAETLPKALDRIEEAANTNGDTG
jgi:hypothetical protein